MGKIKLYELAKELNLTSKELLEKAKKEGIELKSHLSALEDSEVKKLREFYSNKKIEKAKVKEESKKEKNDLSNSKKVKPVIIRREVIFEEEKKKRRS